MINEVVIVIYILFCLVIFFQIYSPVKTNLTPGTFPELKNAIKSEENQQLLPTEQ